MGHYKCRRCEQRYDKCVCAHDAQPATCADEILAVLRWPTKARWMTCAEITPRTTYNMAAVNSKLKKMVSKGILVRATRMGPRGGYGYKEVK
jgi:hypothetical protein